MILREERDLRKEKENTPCLTMFNNISVFFKLCLKIAYKYKNLQKIISY